MKFLAWFRPLLQMVRKEFKQILRDRQSLRMSLFMPTVQLLVLGYAATTDLKNVRLAVLDDDHSPQSRLLAQSYFQNSVFTPTPPPASSEAMEDEIFRGHADMSLWIPNHYAQKIASGESATLGMIVDGENSNAAARSLGYAQQVVRQEELRLLEQKKLAHPNAALHQVEARTRFFYNPELESRLFMVPGILVILITMLSGMMCGMAIVREKELGTLEQLLVTPLTPGQLIAGKLIPFAILATFVFTLSGSIGVLWFKVPLMGSPLLLYGCLWVYLLVTLGGALLASTVSHTQQQAMFTIWFFSIFGILTSGYFYPVENMPKLIYYLSYGNPMRWIIGILRAIFLKGAGFSDVFPNLVPLFIMGVLTFTIAVARFRKRIA